MACRTCETKGEPLYCTLCEWRGFESSARYKESYISDLDGTNRRAELHALCPECNDEVDVKALPLDELIVLYQDECADCPQDGDVHVYPFGQVCDAPGIQPEHDLRGTGCWCIPDVARYSSDEARVIVHRAVEVS